MAFTYRTVFDVKRCDNPDCMWSEYKLIVTKDTIDLETLEQKMILVSTLKCECETISGTSTVVATETEAWDTIPCLFDRE